jgi:hypothetical protein
VAFPAAFAFFHLALANAESLALAAALICLFGFELVFAGVVPRNFAHLALAAAAIRARPAALILLVLGALAVTV